MTGIVFDTETTGLPLPSSAPLKKQPHIIELGAVRVVEGKVVAEFNQLIKPPVPLPPKITKITGITEDDLAGAPAFKEVLGEWREFVEGADCLIAHNAPFDTSMMEFEMRRLGKEGEWPWGMDVICTVEEYQHLFGYRPRLIQLYEYFIGKELDQTHRASDDARALAEVLEASHFWRILK